MVASLPVGGLYGGHDPNSQPLLPTCVGYSCRPRVPLSLSAGAEVKGLEARWSQTVVELTDVDCRYFVQR